MLVSANEELTYAIDVSGGGAHTAVVRWKENEPELDGTVWSCGNQADGRLGNGNTSSGDVLFPTKVKMVGGSALTGIYQVSAGPTHTLALDKDGHVWAWGDNSYGQLGDGLTADNGYARRVKDSSGTGLLSDIVMVSAGGESTNGRSMALAADGTIWVWGRNDEGQLGNGTTASAAVLPVAHTQNHVYEGEPSVSLAYSLTGSAGTYGVVLTASPSHTGSSGVEGTNLTFYLDGAMVGSRSNAPWTVTLPDIGPGRRHAYVIATDENGVASMSPSVSFDAFDWDNDGLPNDWEIANGLNFQSPADSIEDPDQDGLNNLREYQHSTDPHDEDTDDDDVPDGPEVFGN
jgi:hypothetical protein